MTSNTKTRLVPKKLSQAAQDYKWWSDEELSRLNAEPPYAGPFSYFLNNFLAELSLSSSDRQAFAIETATGQHIGNCSLYNIDHVKREAEVGITIGDRNYWDQGFGSDALQLLIDYAFNRLDLSRLYLKTLLDNQRAQRCFSKCGFRPYGMLEVNGHPFVTMELLKPRQENATLTRLQGEIT